MHPTEICKTWFFLNPNVPTKAPKKMQVWRKGHISYSRDNESKPKPDGKVTKQVTHVVTPQTDILMLKEDICRNQRI